jgi:hypothetical protein
MSSESERADYYEKHKGDPEVWGEPLPAKPRRRLASMISVRLSPDEAEAIREMADSRGLSLSGFLRMAALKEARRGETRTRPTTVVAPVSVPTSLNVSEVAVTVLSMVGHQDVGKTGGAGLATQSAASGGSHG